jgi:hypothetical protein
MAEFSLITFLSGTLQERDMFFATSVLQSSQTLPLLWLVTLAQEKVLLLAFCSDFMIPGEEKS